MKEIVERLHENRQVELAKSILESNGYEVRLKEAEENSSPKEIAQKCFDIIKKHFPELVNPRGIIEYKSNRRGYIYYGSFNTIKSDEPAADKWDISDIKDCMTEIGDLLHLKLEDISPSWRKGFSLADDSDEYVIGLFTYSSSFEYFIKVYAPDEKQESEWEYQSSMYGDLPYYYLQSGDLEYRIYKDGRIYGIDCWTEDDQHWIEGLSGTQYKSLKSAKKAVEEYISANKS